MKGKFLAAALLVAVCLCLLAVEGISQSPPPSTAPPGLSPDNSPYQVISPPVVIPPAGDASLEQLVQELKSVRAQHEALKAQEKTLLAKIAQKVEEKRKDLQKAEQILRQLQGKPKEESEKRKSEPRPTSY
jgi:hypothetical protein